MSDEIKGFKSWKNKNNGFQVIELHYTADERKRSKEWKKQASFGMTTKQWMTEFELSWETYTGEPVYGREFTLATHVRSKPFVPDTNIPLLLRGWDFGGNHSCVVCQYISGKLYVIEEYANVGYNTRRIARDIVEDCNIRYGSDFHYVDIIDPSGMWEGKTSDGMACADVMRELGLQLVPGVQEPTRRVDAVMRMLITMKEGEPCLQVNPQCKTLIDGFLGGYHYPDKPTKSQKSNRPEKNEYSHIHDALQYVCTRVHEARFQPEREVLTNLAAFRGPRYEF